VKALVIAAALIAFSGQAAPTAALPHVLHLVYQFGYNTKVASSGQGTGTTTIDVYGPADDGGWIVTGQDFWWNTVRPRAANTCEVYAGSVSCKAAPYAISPIQLTVFPLLAAGYFKGLAANPSQAWTRDFSVYAAILPGAGGMAGQPTTWNFSYDFVGKGPIPKSAPPLILVSGNGTLEQDGGFALQAKSKQRIAYDPANKVPAFVSDVRTHVPARSVYNNDLIEVKLIKIQRG